MWRKVWITGASTGLGREIAIRLATRGIEVIATARSADKLDALAREQGGVVARPADVTDAAAVAGLVGDISTDESPVDLVILNAGAYTPLDAASGLDPDVFRKIVDVNYLGVVNAIAAVLPGMVARRGGHIAIVASVAGYRGLPKAAAYGPTKAALINLAECLNSELEPHGVTISLINPGFVRTPMTAQNDFPMPFIMEPGDAAGRIIEGLEAGRYEIAFPRRFAFILKFLRLLPNTLFFWIIRKTVMKG